MLDNINDYIWLHSVAKRELAAFSNTAHVLMYEFGTAFSYKKKSYWLSSVTLFSF
jgi:hypothetical protein